MTDPLPRATDRLLSTVDTLPDPDWAAPSLCDGWSRAHVIAHLALNAEGLAGVVRGVLDGTATPMYSSDEARDADIETLAAADHDVVRFRLKVASAALTANLADLPEVGQEATFERTPGGAVLSAHVVPLLRLREVEMHHADLRAGYGYDDWPVDVATHFLDLDAGRYVGRPLRARATDTGRTYELGSPTGADPEVLASTAALAWWLSGRDPGDQMTSSTGTVPTLEGR